MVKLSILDQSPIAPGGGAAEAFRQTIELAKHAERLGFSRFWVSEHHDTPGLAGSAPEVLIAAVAAHTSRIRVGSAGVLLPHYSPYKVAETFRVLEALYPGRIDLGLGRAPGGMPGAARALRYGRMTRPGDDYPALLDDLAGFLNDSLPPEHRFHGLRATPIADTSPEVWLLGSGDTSARLAAETGASFAYAHFISRESGAEAAARYRREFRAGAFGGAPRVAVCASALCADTDEAAERLAAPLLLRILRMTQGDFSLQFPSETEAERYPYTEEERERIAAIRGRLFIGGPATVRERLLACAEEHGADELVAVTMTERFVDRLRSYELLAEAFGIGV